MKKAFYVVSLFYAAMAGVPILLWLIAILSSTHSYQALRYALGILLGIGSIIFGVIGFRDVFLHG